MYRAERLAAKGLLSMIHPTELTPDSLLRAITRSLQQPRPPRPQDIGIPLNGAITVSKAMKQLFLATQQHKMTAAHLRHSPRFREIGTVVAQKWMA